jgi:hypothetical protein
MLCCYLPLSLNGLDKEIARLRIGDADNELSRDRPPSCETECGKTASSSDDSCGGE